MSRQDADPRELVIVQNPDQGDFSGSLENTQLMVTFSRTDLNANQHKNDQTHNIKNFENGDFPVLRSKYDRQMHLHHSFFCMVLYFSIFSRLPSLDFFIDSIDRKILTREHGVSTIGLLHLKLQCYQFSCFFYTSIFLETRNPILIKLKTSVVIKFFQA